MRISILKSVALLLASLGLNALAAPALVITSPTPVVAVGEVFTLSLKGESFSETAGGVAVNNVSGGQAFSFSYSAASFEILSISIAPRWYFGPANKTGTVDATAGTVTGLGFGVFPATTDDDFDIATFTLKAIAPGSGSFSITGGQIIGTVGGEPAQLISATPAALTVSITAVPEPTPSALLLLGLGAVAVLRLSRMSQ